MISFSIPQAVELYVCIVLARFRWPIYSIIYFRGHVTFVFSSDAASLASAAEDMTLFWKSSKIVLFWSDV